MKCSTAVISVLSIVAAAIAAPSNLATRQNTCTINNEQGTEACCLDQDCDIIDICLIGATLCCAGGSGVGFQL